MSEKRSVQLFIQDVFDAIEKINSYVSGITGEKELKNDKKTYDAVIWNFTVIGEAVKNIYEEVRKNHPNVEWKEIMAMRNLLVHEYWGINEGGMPLEKSSGLEISITTFPLKFVGFASLSTSRVESPFVQRNTTSPNCAASSNVPYDAAAPFDFAHATAFSFEAERDPILTE